MGFDATTKISPEMTRLWGRVIRMDQEVIERVTRKWTSYGLT